MKKIYILFVAALCLLVPSCDKTGGGEGNQGGDDIPVVPPDDEDKPSASNTTLLSLLTEKILEYNLDASVPTNHVFICAHRANTSTASNSKLPRPSRLLR